jgi:hypothetical protein
MAAGLLLPRALEDPAALPEDAHERVVAGQIRLQLQYAPEKKPRQAPEEKEFVVTMLSTWDDAREEGQLMQARSALRRVLAARKLRPGPADEAKIDACTDLARLDRWLDQALVAQTVAEALKARTVASAPKARTAASAPKARTAASAPARRPKSTRS